MSDNYESMTVVELRKTAKELGVKLPAGSNKQAIIDLIREKTGPAEGGEPVQTVMNVEESAPAAPPARKVRTASIITDDEDEDTPVLTVYSRPGPGRPAPSPAPAPAPSPAPSSAPEKAPPFLRSPAKRLPLHWKALVPGTIRGAISPVTPLRGPPRGDGTPLPADMSVPRGTDPTVPLPIHRRGRNPPMPHVPRRPPLR